MRISFYVNASKSGARDAAERLAALARDLHIDMDDSNASGVAPETSLVVALGGDGTILRCVHEHPGVPVLGFNLGGLGYLSSVEERDFDSALELLAAGRYRISERTMLASNGHLALNDIVITREMTGRAALMDLSVDGHRATRYLADGLVIATPTGSTAYSLSAGGPVVMPDSRSFVVTPMNPHALGIRPQVIADSARLVVASVERGASAADARLGVYADGESVAMLAPGESLEISKSDKVAKFVELEGYDPYAVLAHKLGWTGTSL